MTKNYLLKVVIIFAVLCQFINKASAQYAIGGTAGTTLTNSVYWLKWDPAETGTTMITSPINADATHILNGTYVWQYSPTVRITAIIANETFTNGGSMFCYTPGQFTGDGLDLLYSSNNLTKPDSRGVVNSGIATTGGETAAFDIDLKVAILINGVYTDVVYPGMVIGDAESIDSQGEYISGTTPNSIAWQLLNKRTQGNASDSHYLMDLSNNGSQFKLRADLAPGNFGVQAVMFAHGARNLSLNMFGSGITAIAIGFVLPFDQGDAPQTFGAVGHYIDNFAITDVFQGDGTYSVVNYPTTPLVPSANVYIGANNVDADGNQQFTTNADGDDTNGVNDEATIAPNTLPDLKVNQPGDYSVTLPVTNGKGTAATLYGWVDFDGNGVFTSDELVTANVPAGANNQNITLTWTNASFRNKIKVGNVYARFRITTTALSDDASTTTVDERSTSYAADGEVEDYKLKSVLGITIAGTVHDDPNGNLDNQISGTGIGTMSGSQLYAYLVSGTAIVNKATVAANGTYSFTGADNGTYTVAISTNNIAIGGTLAQVAANLPSAWVPSGAAFGTNNAAGTGVQTGTPNMQIALTTPGTSLDVSGIDFGADQRPLAVSDAATSFANVPTTINVLANDSDPDGTLDATSVRIKDPADGTFKSTVTVANEGTYTVNTTTGVVTFTALSTFAGNTTPITYTVNDNFGAPASSLVTTQISIAVKPVGVNDNNFTEINTPVTTNVKSNDGATNANATVAIASNPSNGSVVVNTGGTVTYTPVNNFLGTDTFTYTITTNGQTSNPITVTIVVTNTPTGNPDASTTPINTPVITNVQSNDGSFGQNSTVAQGTAPAHGSIVVNADQTITYTPVATYTGKDSYTYIITKNGNQSQPVTVSLTVTPVGVNDTYSTPINTAITSTVTSNDGNSALNNTVLATAGAHGTTTVNASNQVTYTPANNYIGTDSYTYTLNTPDGVASNTVTVNMTIRPAGVADASTTLVGTPVNTTVTTNDGVSATGATVTPTAGAHGTTSATGGVVTYTPAAGFVGIDTYTYTLTNNSILSDPITVTITVNPVAVNDATSTPINTATATTVTANDGASGTGATVNVATPPAHGTAVVTGTGIVTYTPTTGYTGLDTYTYTLTNNGATSASATVTVSVKPVGTADASTTPINTAVTTSVKTNDGASGTGTTLAIGTSPTHGTAVINNTTGQITFTPTTGYVGTDTYTYTLTTADNVVSDPVTVTITVSPVGVNDTDTTPINTAVATTVTANDGASATGATLAVVTAPTHGAAAVTGTGVITYTPTTGYTGLDTYTYTLTNNGATSAPITVTISVKPVGVADASTTPINTAVTTLVKANDGASGTGTTLAIGTAPAHGTAVVNNTTGQITFTPTNNYVGTDTYTYILTTADGVVSNPVTVNLTVSPVGVNDVVITPINTANATNVASNDGASATGATVAVATAPTHGTAVVTGTGIITYTPTTNYMGLDTYTYTLTNNGVTSAPITVNISVRPVGSNDVAITATNTPVSITVKNNDGPSGTGTTIIAGNGTNGTTSVNNTTGVVTYTPQTGFNGTDTFTYTLNTADGVASNAITVTVTVSPRPVGSADAVSTNINTATTTTVTANDTDGTGATVTLATTPGHGVAQVNGDNTVTYTPTTNYVGLDTYTYTIFKNGLSSNPITVTVSVKPVGVNDASTTNINTAVPTTVKGNDGISATGTTVLVATQPAHGTTSVSAAGVVTYTPTNNYIGLDTYTYTLNTADGVASNPITVNLTVLPVAVADAASTPINTPVAVTVKTNDGASGTGTTVTPTTPAHGTTTVDASGVVTYTPTTGYVGPDTFNYTLTTPDGAVSAPVAVTLSITPTGTADVAATVINTPTTTTVTANDGASATGATVTVANQPTHGTTSVNASGQVTYTPTTNYIGLDSFTYTLTNNGVVSAPINVSVTVAPVGVNDASGTPINTAVATTVKANDGQSATGTTVTVATQPTHGTTSVDAAGVVTYTPTTNYIGLDTYTYTLKTADGATSAPITVNISVQPVAVADVATTSINTPVATTVKTNDGPSGTGTTVTVSTQPTHGTTSVDGQGVVTYTPATGYTGPDTYSYTLTTPDGVVSTPVAVTVSVVPTGVADVAATVINTPITTTVTANDGASATGATVAVATQPTHGTTSVNASGQVTYTPTADYIGVDSYTYTLTNGGVVSAPINVSVTVAPVGVNDASSTVINVAVPTTVKANDGASATGTTVTVATQPTHGTTSVDASGVVTFTPTAGYMGKDTYTYTLKTADGITSAPITVNLSVKPLGTADNATTTLNTAVPITVKTNDGGSATGTTVGIGTTPGHGTATVNASTGLVTYTPTTGYTGTDTFTYTLTTADGVVSDPVTVTVTVGNQPTGVSDFDLTNINVAKTTNVLANDGTGAATPVAQASAPSHGAIVINATGTITYTPATNYVGLDTYKYTMTKNGQTSAPITVTIAILPVGTDDIAATNLNTPVAITVKANDGASGTGTTVATSSTPAHGTTSVDASGLITYTPATGFLGSDTFTYTLNTADGVSSNDINVTVNVTTLPVGTADAVTTTIGQPASNIPVTANDADGSGATVAAGSTVPSHGSIVVNANGTITYTPVATYTGKDVFTYTITKNGQTSLPINVTVSIKPQGVADNAFTSVSTAVPITVKANDGASGGLNTVAVATTPTHGTTTVDASGVVTYTPATGYIGTDSFSYTLTTPDGVVSNPVTVNVTINNAGQGVPDTDATIINQAKATAVTANDGSIATGATVSVATQPAHGTAVANTNGTITYTPVTNYVGLDTYTYILTNGATVSNPITVTMSVKPTGVTDAALTPINTPVITAVTANDQPSTPTTTVVATNGSHGTTSVDSDGQITYTPNTGFTGSDTYTYTLVTPDGVSSDPITVIVNIRLIGTADAATTPVNTAIVLDVKANDGASGPGSTVSIATRPSHGTAVVDNSTGKVTYTPTNSFTGTDTFTYNLSIPGAVSDPITVTITVISQGSPDFSTTPINTPVITNVKANDGASNTNATVTIAAGPGHALVSINGDGTVTYTPVTDYVGVDTYTYTLTNGSAVSSPITVTVTVIPAGLPDNYTTSVATPVLASIKDNDGPSGTLATLAVATAPAHGTAVVDGTGNNFTYTPAAGYVGTDTFFYTLTKNGATSNPILVTITIRPDGVNDTDQTPVNTPVTTNVKANDGAALATATVAVTSNPSHGTVVVNANGTVTYTPATGYTGIDTYNYQLTLNGSTSTPILVTITVYKSGISLAKTANNAVSKVGDVINYTIVVTNTGSVAVTNVIITDPGADAGSVTPSTIASLASGASATVTAKHTLTQADVDNGGFTNVAFGTGTDPGGNPIPTTPSTDPTQPGSPGGGTTTPITTTGAVTLTKTGVASATQIVYTFVVKNTGNATLNTVTLTDTKLGLSAVAIGTGTLAPGASFTYTSTYALTQADVDAGSVNNTATINAKDTKGNTVTGTGNATTTLPPGPKANDDSSPTTAGQPVNTPVLGNDTPGAAPFNPATVVIVTQPAHGTVTVNPDGTITYTPASGFSTGDTYTYKVKDSNGFYTNTATVTIVNTFINITIPTLFTPNGDGINDVFEIRGLNQFASASIRIVNRWGNLVYETNNYQNNWAGEGLNEGTYYYILTLKKTASDAPIVMKGYTTLIRSFKK